jgi:hypothetical protein
VITDGWLQFVVDTYDRSRREINVQVKLARDWTDPTGAAHHAGDIVEVDTVTLAELEQTGVVTPNWAGPTKVDGWAGPTGAAS